MARKRWRSLDILAVAALLGLGATGTHRVLRALARAGISRLTSSLVNRLLKDRYEENLWELIHTTSRLSAQTVVENSLRAECGNVITRPLGSQRHYDELDKLVFDFAQLARIPRPSNLPVDTSVVIGPRAKRPMQIEIPIMLGGMAYGLALTGEAKLALARGSALAGTSTNSGEGVPAPGEIEAARKYVLQISRSFWNRDVSLIRQADMLEIQLGQGATGGTGHLLTARQMAPSSRKRFGVSNTRPALIYTQLPEILRPSDLGKVVDMLREHTDVPIGVKIGAGKFLEEDLEIALDAGVDAIWLEGGQAGTHAAAPILEDDHGLPTFFALCRASRYLADQKLKGVVSLIVSGGLFTPGDFLKCLALGADAVGIGTAALLAISHPHVGEVLPWEPPTQLTFATGNSTAKFDVEEGAKSLYYFLMSCTEEMILSARALGKHSLRSVSRSDLISVDPYVAEVAGVDMAHRAQPLGLGSTLQPEWLRREHELAHEAALDLYRS